VLWCGYGIMVAMVAIMVVVMAAMVVIVVAMVLWLLANSGIVCYYGCLWLGNYAASG
jgi:hypothetical protein